MVRVTPAGDSTAIAVGVSPGETTIAVASTSGHRFERPVIVVPPEGAGQTPP